MAINKKLTGIIDRLVATSIEEQFIYEPSEIIQALFEEEAHRPRKKSFKKRKEDPQQFRLFSENTYYIKKG